MKKLTLSTLAASLLLMVSSAMAADTKIAFVQADKILQNAPQTAEIGKKLEKEFSPRTAILEKQQKLIEAQTAALDKDGLTLSDADRNKKVREINDLKIEFERKQREVNEDLNIRKNEELAGLQERINKAINTIAEASGYDVVLFNGVAYSSKRADITDIVIKALAK